MAAEMRRSIAKTRYQLLIYGFAEIGAGISSFLVQIPTARQTKQLCTQQGALLSWAA